MNDQQKFELLKIEMGIIQSTLDKYDDLIFKNRNFFITLWLGCMGLSFSIKTEFILLLAVTLSILYWFFEGLMRHKYWYKYVDRYRYLRTNLNSPDFNINEISIYDSTNHYQKDSRNKLKQAGACFFKIEPSLLYILMGAAAFGIWTLIKLKIVAYT